MKQTYRYVYTAYGMIGFNCISGLACIHQFVKIPFPHGTVIALKKKITLQGVTIIDLQ